MKIINDQSLSVFNGKAFLEENGYKIVRIPGIVSLPDGALLCYYECRSGGDWSAIDIGMQKSVDAGRTWSPTRILVSGKGRNTMNNPVMVAQGDTVHLMYCENYKRVFIITSIDGGETFSSPWELTHTVESLTSSFFWSVIAVGPGHGISVDDTLIVPVWFAQNRNDIFAHHPSVIAVLRGENGGSRWGISPLIGQGMLNDPSECCIAETGEGTLLLNIRNENAVHRRALSCSPDCGRTWNTPHLSSELPDPVCCAGMCACNGELLFSNCSSRTGRKNLTVRRLDSNGAVLESLTLSKAGGYSDVCFVKEHGRAFVIYENGSSMPNVAEIEI